MSITMVITTVKLLLVTKSHFKHEKNLFYVTWFHILSSNTIVLLQYLIYIQNVELFLLPVPLPFIMCSLLLFSVSV
jgi:hypothetical protein